MKSLAFLRTMLLFLLIAAPGLCWGANALIVHDGTPGIEADALANLTTHLTAATFTVTPNVGVPGGSLATYQQIWDIRFNNTTPLSASDITAYTTYLAGGGSLFVMGENTGFITRDNSIVSLITAVGGGTITITTPSNTETVMAPFTGPTPLTTITFLAAAGATYPPGNGRFVTRDMSPAGAALVFSPGTLTSAMAGTLIAVFDVNFLQAGADSNSQALTDNMIAFLAAPVHLPPLNLSLSVPTLSQWGMILFMVLAGLGSVYYVKRQRRV